MVLITGGARVGKTKMAINICKKLGNRVLYIAASAPSEDAFDKERIRRSRKQRPFNWELKEAYLNLGTLLSEVGGQYDAILIENLSTLVSSLIEHYGYSEANNNLRQVERAIVEDVNSLTSAARRIPAMVVLVTNEVDICPPSADSSTKALMEILGRVNQQVAALSSEVHIVFSGIPLRIK